MKALTAQLADQGVIIALDDDEIRFVSCDPISDETLRLIFNCKAQLVSESKALCVLQSEAAGVATGLVSLSAAAWTRADLSRLDAARRLSKRIERLDSHAGALGFGDDVFGSFREDLDRVVSSWTDKAEPAMAVA